MSETPQTYVIRLADGQQVEWDAERIAAHEGDWKAVLDIVTPREWIAGYSRLLTCVLHSDDVKCEACGGE